MFPTGWPGSAANLPCARHERVALWCRLRIYGRRNASSYVLRCVLWRDDMNWVDTVVLLVVILSAIVAFARGFVTEALGVGAWVGAYFLSGGLASSVRPMMRDWLGNPDIADRQRGALLLPRRD